MYKRIVFYLFCKTIWICISYGTVPSTICLIFSETLIFCRNESKIREARKIIRSSRAEVFYKKRFLKVSQNSQRNTCARVSSLIKLQAWKEALVQVFSSEFCEISKNTFFFQNTSGDCFWHVAGGKCVITSLSLPHKILTVCLLSEHLWREAKIT